MSTDDALIAAVAPFVGWSVPNADPKQIAASVLAAIREAGYVIVRAEDEVRPRCIEEWGEDTWGGMVAPAGSQRVFVLRDAALSTRSQPDVESDAPPQPSLAARDDRDPACVAAWPDCWDGEYDPRCCRFPKSCSPSKPGPPQPKPRAMRNTRIIPHGVGPWHNENDDCQTWGCVPVTYDHVSCDACNEGTCPGHDTPEDG